MKKLAVLMAMLCIFAGCTEVAENEDPGDLGNRVQVERESFLRGLQLGAISDNMYYDIGNDIDEADWAKIQEAAEALEKLYPGVVSFYDGKSSGYYNFHQIRDGVIVIKSSYSVDESGYSGVIYGTHPQFPPEDVSKEGIIGLDEVEEIAREYFDGESVSCYLALDVGKFVWNGSEFAQDDGGRLIWRIEEQGANYANIDAKTGEVFDSQFFNYGR